MAHGSCTPTAGRGKNAMLTAEARVETERASRYLVQLCRHVSRVAQTRPQTQANVEWSDDNGVVNFGRDRCTLRADPGLLTLRAEAPDEESLHQLEQRVAVLLERFGRRDQLTVTWTPPEGAGEQLPGQLRLPTQGGMHSADRSRDRDPGDDTGVPDLSRYPGTGDAGVGLDGEPAASSARWVKVALIIAVVVVLLVLVGWHLAGGGFRGLH